MASGEIKTILVTGATGHQGGAVANLLLSKNHKLRALVRQIDTASAVRLKERGIDLAEGSLEDRESMDKAMAGVDSVFAVTTPFEAGMEAEVRQGITVADAAAAAGVHLVYSSVAWAYANTGIPHFESKWKVEQHMQTLDLRHTIIAPAYFMENATAPWSLPAIRQQNRLAVPLSADVPQASVSVTNIAGMAVLALEQPERLAGKRVDIAGDIVTGSEMAAILAEATGLPLEYYEIDKQTVETEDLRLMFEWYEQNRPTVDIEALRRDYPEVNWLNYRVWAAKQDWPALLAH